MLIRLFIRLITCGKRDHVVCKWANASRAKLEGKSFIKLAAQATWVLKFPVIVERCELFDKGRGSGSFLRLFGLVVAFCFGKSPPACLYVAMNLATACESARLQVECILGQSGN